MSKGEIVDQISKIDNWVSTHLTVNTMDVENIVHAELELK